MKCAICYKEQKKIMSLSAHIRLAHKISSINYYDRYLRNYAADEGFCLNCGAKTTFRNLNIGYSTFCCAGCGSHGKFNGMYGKRSPLKGIKVPKERLKRTLETKRKNNTLKHTENTKRKISLAHLGKRITNIKDRPLFKYYAPKIKWAEEVRRDENVEDILNVKCKKCGNWFTPSMINLKHRIEVLNGIRNGESNLYCSDECKNSCSIYAQVKYPKDNKPYVDRPYQKEWRDEVLKLADFKCEICFSVNNLEAHHILPVKTHPHLQADIDNGICLCKECHQKHGHKDECSTGHLAKIICL